MVDYNQFLLAAKKGYSILDAYIFKNLKEGHVKEKNQTKIIPKIAFDKDLDWISLLGRHNEIHQILKYLSDKQDIQG